MIQFELNKRNIPNLFQVDGYQQIKTIDEWENVGRPYWLNIILQEEYGQFPPVVTPKIFTKTKSVDCFGKAIWEEITFFFSLSGREHAVQTQLIYPKNKRKNPFFIYLNFRPNIPDKYLPIEEIIDNGFGVFTACYNDITKDNADFSDGIAGLFQQNQNREGKDAGKIVYWSYMASRMMDYLQTRKEADKEWIGIAGHSRLGKTALLTAAVDNRFSFACVNNSGASGAALSRGRCEGGESIKDCCKSFPFWYSLNYQKYIDNEDKLPFDQHCLIALVAPRQVYIGAAKEDVWADNDNQILSCFAASKAWSLYQVEGLIAPNRLPLCGERFTQGSIGFYLRAGHHGHIVDDWRIYMETIQNKIKNIGG